MAEPTTDIVDLLELLIDVVSLGLITFVMGPATESITGKTPDHGTSQTVRSGQRPSIIVNFLTIHFVFALFILKNYMNTCELDNPSKTRARNVVRPPLNTAGPIVRRASSVLVFLPPEV